MIGAAAIPTATVFAPVEDGGLDRAGLQGEIARLRRVRQHRLAGLTADSFGGTLPEEIHSLIAAIERSEADVEQAGADVAIAEASLSEAQRARRAKEAELRAALIDANLEHAVLRSALPLTVTSPGTRDAATIDLASASIDDGVDLDEVASARAALAKAERRLAQLVSTPDEAIADAESRLDQALAGMRDLDAALAVLYEDLEGRARGVRLPRQRAPPGPRHRARARARGAPGRAGHGAGQLISAPSDRGARGRWRSRRRSPRVS